MTDLIPIGSLALWGQVIVTVEAVSFRDGERLYLATDANGTVIHCSDGDLAPYVERVYRREHISSDSDAFAHDIDADMESA